MEMRLFPVTFTVLLLCGFLFGQDGSNMNYVKPEDLNDSFIGRRLHLDFGQRSFGAIWDRNKNRSDTIFIELDGKKVKFIEHREDDGFNNWFSQQYLESVDEIDGLNLRITQFELLKINEKDILVKAFFSFTDKDGKILPDKSFTRDLSFKKKDIVEYLFFRKRNN